MAILLKGWIWPIGGVALGRVCLFENLYAQYTLYPTCLSYKNDFLSSLLSILTDCNTFETSPHETLYCTKYKGHLMTFMNPLVDKMPPLWAFHSLP